MDPISRALLTETFLHAVATGQDAYGVQTFGTPVARPGRTQRRILTQFTAMGRQLIPQTKVFLDGDVVITEGDRLTFPDGSAPPIQGLETHLDEFGRVDHYTAFF
jgi:hypothetical protein